MTPDGLDRRRARLGRKLTAQLARARGEVVVCRAELVLAEATGRKVEKRRRQLAEALLTMARLEAAITDLGLEVPPLTPVDQALLEEPPPLAEPQVVVETAGPGAPETASVEPSRGPAPPSPDEHPSERLAPVEPGEPRPGRPASAGSAVRLAARQAAREAAEALASPSTVMTGDAGVLAGSPTVAAAVDVGANSVHMLVAVTGGHRLEPLVDESVFLGLGEGVDRGWLGPELRRDLVESLTAYAATARRLGADQIVLVGTEPLRRVVDAPRIVHEVELAAGLPLYVITHEEEGYLTLIGATGGRPVGHELLVVDVGGGSSEFVSVGRTSGHVATGLQLGSARLTRSFVEHDPPLPEEVARLREAARAQMTGAPDARPMEIIAVGGTASNLAKVVPAAVLDRGLTAARLEEALEALMAEPATVAAERHALRPERTRILPAGAAIMLALLDRYGLDRIHVSEEGIREGAVMVAIHAGVAWRDRLPLLAEGWRGA